MLSINIVDGNSSKLFEVASVELIRADLGDSTDGAYESLSLRATIKADVPGGYTSLNIDSGTVYVMNSSGSTIGTYKLGRQGIFSPKHKMAAVDSQGNLHTMPA